MRWGAWCRLLPAVKSRLGAPRATVDSAPARPGGTLGSALIDRADGNSDRLGGLCRGQHVASAVEDAAGLDDKTGSVNLAGDNALGLDLDTTLRENDPIEPAGDDDVVARNLPFDAGGLAHDKALF